MNSPISINLSFVSPKPTGLSTYALNLIPALNLSDLTLLSPSDRPPFPTALQSSASLYPVPHNLNSSCGKAGHFRRLQWTQFQVPHIQSQLQAALFFSPIPEAPLFTRHPFIVVVHDIIPLRFPNWKSPLTYYFRHYIPQVLNQAQHIICNSIATAQDVSRYFNIPATKLTPIPLAHDAQNFRYLPETEGSSHLPYFFYYGRHDPYKNIHRLINAFASVIQSQSQFQDCQLWIAGSADPRYTPTLKVQAEALGISNRLRFLDYVSYAELPRLLNRAIALVFPSLWEGFGFPVLEAMACGTPVITSNLSSMPEVAGDAAILVDPYNERAIAAAMQQLLVDGAARSQLRQLGLARAQQFSWQKTGTETSALLKQSIESRSGLVL